MKAIHIDDERDSLEVMRILLAECCPQVQLVASVTSVDDGIKVIKEHSPDVVFLDIEMPGKNGFVLLDELRDYDFQVVMVTGYEDYALKAIKYSALDYLLKPLDADDLCGAMKKVSTAKEAGLIRLGHYRTLVEQEDDEYNSLMIASSNGYKNIDINDLVYLRSEAGSYCVLYFTDGTKEVVPKSMNHFEGLLPKDRFHRIHRSHIVNIRAVRSFDSQTSEVVLVNDQVMTVSVRKKVGLKQKISTNQ
jgi:two-component system LytT family response regulator